MFFCCVFLIGGLDDGRNTRTVFAWMFHQGHLAEGKFDPINLFSYPYYLFRLENLFFGMLFFGGNLYLVWQRRWQELLLFVLVLAQMLVFSFTSDKGARYLCAVMPFIAIASAHVLVFLYEKSLRPQWRRTVVVCAGIIFLGLALKSFAIAAISSDYRRVTEDLTQGQAGVKLVTTQPYVLNLFVDNPKDIADCPHNFSGLLERSAQGYRYLVLDPQAYISWTENEVRFLPELANYLGFLRHKVRPQRIYRNFNSAMMERFVFEHSENLQRSIEFLRQNPREHFGAILVYDFSEIVPQMLNLLSHAHGGGHADIR